MLRKAFVPATQCRSIGKHLDQERSRSRTRAREADHRQPITSGRSRCRASMPRSRRAAPRPECGMIVQSAIEDRRLDASADHLQYRHIRIRDTPRSPCSSLPIQVKKLDVNRLIQAERGADALECSGVAFRRQDRGGNRPASAASSRNTNSATTPITGMARGCRRSRYPSILVHHKARQPGLGLSQTRFPPAA